jgi:hypothetical protein
MPWAFAFVVLANATWFVARASYAQDTHPWIYRLLGGIALVCLAAGTVTAVDIQAVPRSVKNVTASAVVVVVTGAMVWLTLRGNRFNGWQLLGTVPIGFAALHRIAYNVGWLQHVELAQLMGMLSSALGLLMLLASLVWRSRGGGAVQRACAGFCRLRRRDRPAGSRKRKVAVAAPATARQHP